MDPSHSSMSSSGVGHDPEVDLELDEPAKGKLGRTDSGTINTSTDIIAHAQYHYNPGRDIVSRGEFMSERQTKAVVAGVWAVEAAGIVLLIVGVCIKLKDNKEKFFAHHIIEGCNVAIGSLCWIGITICMIIYFRRLHQANRSGKRWSPRRKRGAFRTSFIIILTWINVSSFVASNIYVLSGRCRWFDPFVVAMGVLQWTCWNTLFLVYLCMAHNANPWRDRDGNPIGRPDSIIMDAPVTYHAPKLILWAAIEGLLIATGTIVGMRVEDISAVKDSVPDCQRAPYNCHVQTSVIVTYAVLVALLMLYFVGTAFFIRRAFCNLRAKPYHQMRMAHQHLRWSVRTDCLAMAFFAVSIVLFIYVGWGSCVSYLQSWLGFLPMFLVVSGLVAASTYTAMPKDPGDEDKILQIWLQEFAWAEKDVCVRKAERGSSLRTAAAAELSKEPMWCFETSLKMLYWSMLMYDYEENPKTEFSLETAMGLYGLENFELLWERSTDTKALMAWSDDTLVLGFRGTASFANVLADLQAWYATHPPKRGRTLLGTRPFVHQGFLKSWTAGGLRVNVVDRVKAIVDGLREAGRAVKVYVTGHSLGGALATLAAYDIRKTCPCLTTLSVSCYTFGAPRTGNHAFARDYNETVPDTWGIINDQDAVVRGGKFWIMYKRPGHRVIINSDGDLIVRPSFVEASVQRRPGGSSVAQHLLTNYQKSYLAVIKAQFSSKGFQGGRAGVLRVAESTGVQEILDAAGMSAAELDHLDHDGFDLFVTRCKSLLHLPRSLKRKMSGDIRSDVSSASSADARLPGIGKQGSVANLAEVDEMAELHAAVAAAEPQQAADTDADAVEAQLASGGDVDVGTGAPAAHEPPAAAGRQPPGSSQAADGPSLPGLAASKAELEVEPRQLSETSVLTSATDVPETGASLQHYTGKICKGGRCRYTGRNGQAYQTPAQGAADDPALPKPGRCQLTEGAFCLLRDRPRYDMVRGNPNGPPQQQGLKGKLKATAGGALKTVLQA